MSDEIEVTAPEVAVAKPKAKRTRKPAHLLAEKRGAAEQFIARRNLTRARVEQAVIKEGRKAEWKFHKAPCRLQHLLRKKRHRWS